MNKLILLSFAIILFGGIINGCQTESRIGMAEITKWKDNKKAAISLTYDDGTIHQFTVARPIMNKLALPATFYIITGKIEGSAQGKFIGRSKKDIIDETKKIKTNEKNFFERASLIAFTGVKGTQDYHTRSGGLYEAGKIDEAYKLIDTAYVIVSQSKTIDLKDPVFKRHKTDTTTWADYKKYAAEGHEIASHTVTHPRLAILDEPNLLYELEQSKADIVKFLGETYSFSAECPYGTENERVMEYAYKIYPALRNRMPAPYLDEINRGSKKLPYESDKEYIQWQRGPLRNINMSKMKSWVDTCLTHDNIWLVLVFHGVDSVGWEPRTGQELEEYFKYIKERESQLWVATFADVTKYIREAKNTKITSGRKGDHIWINLDHTLDKKMYTIPLTVKVYVPSGWKNTEVKSNCPDQDPAIINSLSDEQGKYILLNASPECSEYSIFELKK